MQKDELKKIIYKNNPTWRNVGANLTAAGLEKLIDTAYEQGHKQGHKQGIANGIALAEKQEGKKRGGVADIFGRNW